ISLRGSMPWKGGYTFFLRKPDDSLDLDDLALRLPELTAFIRDLAAREGVPPILVGYSNGAIITSALIASEPNLVSGAVLLRPMPPGPDYKPAALYGLPILMLGGRTDERRKPEDFPKLERLLREAGGQVAAQLLNCGHGWEASGLDMRLTAAWLAGFDPQEDNVDEL
ncbi:MAG: alpha/beta hydrolase, partial [Deltaproteobacteria bacterium]